MEQCRRCHTLRAASEYRKHRRICLECERAYDRNRYARSEARRRMIAAWKLAHPEVQAAYDKRRRALKREATVARFDWQALQLRMSMFARCYLCDERLDDAVHYDHVKPLAAGGAHMLSNLRPVHALCNLVKSSKWLGIAGYSSLLDSVSMRVNELLEGE